MTNFHVISYTDNFETKIFDHIEVRLATQEEYFEIEVVKVDKEKDKL